MHSFSSTGATSPTRSSSSKNVPKIGRSCPAACFFLVLDWNPKSTLILFRQSRSSEILAAKEIFLVLGVVGILESH